ncbi:hypothetical protein THASP1DRAFT_26007 [Thamnocephalis sphaerospora]|uniref:Uncharacterized protein n=1 Tax=Thamnocephalis sphaerospora TaxID=78915 RepID=A0A4P9XJX7_9FUNG|nr:hypothetical protein THASP1DRAFT_26007 [Thamnocephalis sphaerospora]|eukprot:RKP05510.1 hypothetical protein THASP1DRAFT_26007 [Thamnocephalis sphaerospora]
MAGSSARVHHATEAYALDLSVFPWDAARLLLVGCILAVLAGCFYYAWTSARDAFQEWQGKQPRPLPSRSPLLHGHLRSRSSSPSHYAYEYPVTPTGAAFDEEAMSPHVMLARRSNSSRFGIGRSRAEQLASTTAATASPPGLSECSTPSTWTDSAAVAAALPGLHAPVTLAGTSAPTTVVIRTSDDAPAVAVASASVVVQRSDQHA